jgi:hypothetical protein
VSAFEIFPSALIAAGYEASEIRGYYHHSLFDTEAPRDNRVFASGHIFGNADALGGDLPAEKADFVLNPFEWPQK